MDNLTGSVWDDEISLEQDKISKWLDKITLTWLTWSKWNQNNKIGHENIVKTIEMQNFPTMHESIHATVV
jgi:hypothetical protein